MARNIPVLLVATLLTLVYGRSLSRAWIPALIQAAITFVCVLVGGLVYYGLGQIIGIFVSAIIIFLIFVLPLQKKRVQEELDEARKADSELNEEDK